MSRTLVFICVLFAGATAGVAQGFPGNVPEDLVGDWNCGTDRIYITKLGSIEILGESYVAGRFDADAGLFEVEWDDGARSSWTYEVEPGQSLSLGDAGGKAWRCKPR